MFWREHDEHSLGCNEIAPRFGLLWICTDQRLSLALRSAWILNMHGQYLQMVSVPLGSSRGLYKPIPSVYANDRQCVGVTYVIHCLAIITDPNHNRLDIFNQNKLIASLIVKTSETIVKISASNQKSTVNESRRAKMCAARNEQHLQSQINPKLFAQWKCSIRCDGWNQVGSTL